MFQYVAFVTGTTVLELTAMPYAVVSYTSTAAPLNDNELGPLYADVAETLIIHVTGCTPAEALGNVAAVNSLLDQARRWWQGEPVDAVLLRVQAQESAIGPLDTALLGRSPGAAPAVAMQPTWDATIGRYIIRDVQLQFVRHGQLLNPTTESGTSTAASNPTVQSITIASSVTRSSPIKLAAEFQESGVPAGGAFSIGAILTASAANRLQIYEAELGTLGANVASVADVANHARGGAVARYSPGALATSIGITISPAFDSTSRRFAFWAAVRNNSATTTWGIQVRTSLLTPSATPITTIDASTLNPRVVFLGIVSTQDIIAGGVTGITTFLLLLTASAASGTFDIDYVVIQAVDDETSAALTIFDQLLTASGGAYVPSNLGAGIPTTVDPQWLSKPVAKATFVDNTGLSTYPLGYAGDPYFYSKGSLVACFLGTIQTSWRIVDGPIVNDIAWTATRYPAYLIPE